MDASQLQAFSRATLLGLVLASMVTLAPHGFSCLRGLLSVSLPSAASAIVTPKQCLFIFSNIIVVFLARELKLLSQNRARSSLDDEIVFEPSIKEKLAAAEETVGEERGVGEAAVLMSTQQLDQCEKTWTTLGVKEMPEEEGEEEATGLPADELNRRVEDFIARFNMERQLEERTMVVCF